MMEHVPVWPHFTQDNTTRANHWFERINLINDYQLPTFDKLCYGMNLQECARKRHKTSPIFNRKIRSNFSVFASFTFAGSRRLSSESSEFGPDIVVIPLALKPGLNEGLDTCPYCFFAQIVSFTV